MSLIYAVILSVILSRNSSCAKYSIFLPAICIWGWDIPKSPPPPPPHPTPPPPTPTPNPPPTPPQKKIMWPRVSRWTQLTGGSLSWIRLERFSPPLPLPRWPPSPVNQNAPWWCKSCPCGHPRSIKSQKTAPSPLKERLTGQYPWSTCRGAARSSPRPSPRPWSRLSSGLFRKKKRRTLSSPCWRT